MSKKSTKALYRFTLDCGRMGSLDGLFTATDAEVKDIIGKHVYFGEVLGKHSEIAADMEAENFERLTDNPDFVKTFEQFKCASGTNPFGYLDEESDT